MPCSHYECMEISQDVLKKYGNVSVLNENYFQSPTESE